MNNNRTLVWNTYWLAFNSWLSAAGLGEASDEDDRLREFEDFTLCLKIGAKDGDRQFL